MTSVVGFPWSGESEQRPFRQLLKTPANKVIEGEKRPEARNEHLKGTRAIPLLYENKEIREYQMILHIR